MKYSKHKNVCLLAVSNTEVLYIILSVFYFFDLFIWQLSGWETQRLLSVVGSGLPWNPLSKHKKIRHKINNEQDNCFTSAKNALLKSGYNGFAARGVSGSFRIPPDPDPSVPKIPTSLISSIVTMGGSGSVKNNYGSGSKWSKQNITSLCASGRNLQKLNLLQQIQERIHDDQKLFILSTYSVSFVVPGPLRFHCIQIIQDPDLLIFLQDPDPIPFTQNFGLLEILRTLCKL